MSSSVTAIALEGETEDGGVAMPAIDSPIAIDEGFAGPALAMQQFGLLAAPGPASDGDRRIEDWIASQLELSTEAQAAPSPRNIWNRLIDRLPAARRHPRPRMLRNGPETAFAEWSRFRVAYRRGITVVRPVDVALVKERHVRELTRDLIELIEAGNHRLILNFQGVERVASWVALALDEAYRRASAADGGELKVCGLAAPLAAVLELAGMAPGIELHPDEASALDADWPRPATPRALPVDILLALIGGPEPPPLRGGAPADASVARTVAYGRMAGRPFPDRPTAAAGGEPGLWLIVQMGSSKGRPVPVVGDRFLIGRQSDCHLRLSSPMVSKLHAAIERRGGRIVLADLGSTNGTVLNGRLLRGKEAEIHDGDRLQVGPAVCTLATVAHRQGGGKVEEQVAEWLHGEDAARGEPINALDTAVIATSSPSPADADADWNIKTEIIQDVLVVTPEVSELENDATIEQLRVHLHSLLSQQVPRRVVVNLEYVAHLTGQAIGVLLAHHLRLDRSGGGMRICQARARMMAILHQVRLTVLVECHPTLDEAVLSAWPDAHRRRSSGQ